MKENLYTLTASEVMDIRARAWSEGYQDGWSDRSHIGEDRTRNPYKYGYSYDD